jgi:hypothetical protein
MRKHFLLSDNLLHVICDTWSSLCNILFWHICNVSSNTHTHLCIRYGVQTSIWVNDIPTQYSKSDTQEWWFWLLSFEKWDMVLNLVPGRIIIVGQSRTIIFPWLALWLRWAFWFFTKPKAGLQPITNYRIKHVRTPIILYKYRFQYFSQNILKSPFFLLSLWPCSDT